MRGIKLAPFCLALMAVEPSATGSQIYFDLPVDPRAKRIDANTSRLQVSIALDKKVYFPGEALDITVTVRNPTNEALEVWEPFHPTCGGLDLLKKGTERARELGVEFSHLSPSPYSGAPPRPDRPVVMLQPNESRTKQLRSDDDGLGIMEGSDMSLGAQSPGTFRLVYSYARAAYAEFEIVMPALETWTFAREERTILDQEGRALAVPYDPVAFVLRYEDQRHLCVSYRMQGGRTPAEFRYTAWVALQALQPYVCIAGLEEPLASMELRPRPPQRFEVRWRSVSGRAGITDKEIRDAVVRPRVRRPGR